MNPDSFLIAEGFPVRVNAQNCKRRSVQRIYSVLRRAAVSSLSAERYFLRNKAEVVSAHVKLRIRLVRLGMEHHCHVNSVKSALRDKLLLAAHEAYFILCRERAPCVKVNKLLSRNCHKCDRSVKLLAHSAFLQAVCRAEHCRNLRVVTARMGVSLPVSRFVSGAFQTIHLADNTNVVFAAFAAQLCFNARQRMGICVFNAEHFKLAAHKSRGFFFKKTELGIGKHSLADFDDAFGIFRRSRGNFFAYIRIHNIHPSVL